jgi:hypothetical protein
MVNPSLIPSELIHSWAQSAQSQLSALLQTPNLTLGHIEELLEAQARTLMLPILGAAAHSMAAQQPFQCPVCQQPLLAEAQARQRSLDTVFP